jgi:tetratricopeptide (TPR) repeat protein
VERRRQLHQQVAECIERLFADRLDEFHGLLAYHYARAEDWEKAQEHLLKAGDQAGRVAADAEALAHYRHAVTAYARAFGDRWDPLERARLERKMGEALSRRGEHDAAAEYLERALRLLRSPLPASRSGLRSALIVELLRQAGHRIAPSLFVRRSPPDVASTERSRIYEVLGWIDYFANQERFILGTLAHLNWAEEAGLPVGVVRGTAACGIICDVVGWHRLAEHYHRRALTLGDQVEDPTAVSLAHLCMGFHEHFLGHWDSALEHFERSAHLSSRSGDLRGSGAALSRNFHICVHRGEIARARALAQEVLRIGEEGGDSQVRAWGLLACGIAALVTGPLDGAAGNFTEALQIYTAIGSHSDVAETHGYLGQCYLRQGKREQALAELDRSERVIRSHGVRGHGIGLPRNAIAAGWLAAAEDATGEQRPVALCRARSACRDAIKQAKIDRSWFPTAARNHASYCWLEGRRRSAEQWWARSLHAAEEMGARYDIGLTHLEIGQRMGSAEHLSVAATIFSEIGATVDLEFARRASTP